EQRVDIAVIADVVAGIQHRRAEDRRQPDGVYAQLLQVVEVVQYAVEIADAVAVAVGKGARVDLVDGRAFPPRMIARVAHAGLPYRRCACAAACSLSALCLAARRGGSRVP